MNRPYIVCHMMTALDGKITGPFMNTEVQALSVRNMSVPTKPTVRRHGFAAV